LPGLTALAIDLGGSHAACALVRDGGILASKNIPAEGTKGLGGLLPAINETLFALMRDAQIDRAQCSAVTLAFPGIAVAKQKRVVATNAKFDDAPNLDLAGWFEGAFGVPFLIENDARLALLGEAGFGAARGAEDAVMITLGTGIGGAAMIGGRLVESKHGLAGTIGGHLPLNMNGRQCTCGNIGCAETEGSTFFLPVVYREKAGDTQGMLSTRETIGFAELFAAVEAGDKPAIAALEHCMKAWAVLTVGLIHMYDPEVVVLGGSVMKREAEILPRLQQYVKEHAWTPNRTVPLRTAVLGSNAALLGALPLVEYSL
jgi:glucokinase